MKGKGGVTNAVCTDWQRPYERDKQRFSDYRRRCHRHDDSAAIGRCRSSRHLAGAGRMRPRGLLGGRRHRLAVIPVALSHADLAFVALVGGLLSRVIVASARRDRHRPGVSPEGTAVFAGRRRREGAGLCAGSGQAVGAGRCGFHLCQGTPGGAKLRKRLVDADAGQHSQSSFGSGATCTPPGWTR